MLFSNSGYTLLQLNPSQFDFNLQFEQLFFSIVPAALFLAISPFCVLCQIRKPRVVDAPGFLLLKVWALSGYSVLQLTLLVLAIDGSFQITTIFMSASILRLLTSLLMIVLSVLDHSRSPRPSVALCVYLVLTLLLEIVQARSLFLLSTQQAELTYSVVFVTSVVYKLALLLLEASSKSSFVRWHDNKSHSPEETSGIFSLGVFFWLNKLFCLAYRKVLTVEDLYSIDSCMTAETLHARFTVNMDYSKLKESHYELVKVLARTLRVQLLLPILPRLALLGFTVCQPLLLEQLTRYLSHPETSPNTGYGFIGAAFLIYSGIGISTSFYWYYHNRARTMLRTILVTEIFFKATTHRIGVSDDSVALTLMSTDIERIRLGLRNIHETWASTLQATLAAWMLYNRLGLVCIAPVGLVIGCFTALGILMKWTGDSQRKWMTAVEKRVGLTATVVSNMKTLKMSSLSNPTTKILQRLRVNELAAGVRWRQIFITAATLGFIPQLLAPPLAFAFAQHKLDVSTMFTSLAFITLLTFPLSQVFEGVPQILSGLACIGRIQRFLESDPREDFRELLLEKGSGEKKSLEDQDGTPNWTLLIENASFGWEAGKFVLSDINTSIPQSKLTIIVGRVGAGKSTLCKAILGETPFSKGIVSLRSNIKQVGFCEQSAFLSNGSIRDNIIVHTPFDAKRYLDVTKATALDIDFALWSDGDRTNIGSDGITLSGGQKQRVSLARALYLQCDLLLLDDVFSGLDADTEEIVFQRVFSSPNGLLRNRLATVVLCTHSVKRLAVADHIIVLEDSKITEQGSFQDLVAKAGYVHSLNLTGRSGDSKRSPEPESLFCEQNSPDQPEAQHNDRRSTIRLPVTPDLNLSRLVGNTSVYKHYAKSAGLLSTAFSILFAALWGFFTNFPTIWLTYWIKDVSLDLYEHSYAYYVGIYTLLQMCALISLLLLAITLWVVALKRAGVALYSDALKTLIHAPLHFFTDTDTGVIVNLFSQDFNLIDTELPNALLDTLFSIFQALGQAAVMLTSSIYLAIAYPFLAVLLFFVGRFYLRTSKQLRLLDLEAKSPLYTHFLDTVRGIATVRASAEQKILCQMKYAKMLGYSTIANDRRYLFLMIQEWLKLVLNLVVVVLAVVMVTLSVRLHANSAFIGASLFSLITFGENLAGLVLYYTKLENSLGAVARLSKFSAEVLPEDRKSEDTTPPAAWPANGTVEFKGVSAGYTTNDLPINATDHLALRNITLKIQAGEKVAICGRTGSGKSSLLAILLKLLDPLPFPLGGEITIDGLPLSRLDRTALRRRIIVVPQEAVFLPKGTSFKTNLSPSDDSTAAECEDILKTVGLWKVISDQGGLNVEMNVAAFSAGQRQLFSFGRALLRQRVLARCNGSLENNSPAGGVLLLDEVSSSVDNETEQIIHRTIGIEFKAYTVLAVSHRLEAIMDFDRVIVMDSGEIVEDGHPRTLAQQCESRFGKLLSARA